VRFIIPGLALIGLGFLIVSGALSSAIEFANNIIMAFQNAF